MKKTKLILIAILIGITSTVNAQEESDGFSLGQYLNHLFAPMDSSRFISTGLFMDKGGIDAFS
ncbi:MAG: hypothetical protein J5I91_03390 [Bacteroidetes bacterium]|nr:hypothetical protein [Bacteroidota bacterium]